MAVLCSVAYGISEFDNVCCRQCRTDVCLSALCSVSFTYGQLAYTSFSRVITCFLQIGNATILFLLL